MSERSGAEEVVNGGEGGFDDLHDFKLSGHLCLIHRNAAEE